MKPKYIIVDLDGCEFVIEDLLTNAYLHSAELVELIDLLLDKICTKPFDVKNITNWLNSVRDSYNIPYPVTERSAVGDYIFQKLMTLSIHLTHELARLGLTYDNVSVYYKVEQVLNKRYFVLSERSRYAQRRYT